MDDRDGLLGPVSMTDEYIRYESRIQCESIAESSRAPGIR